MLARALDRPVYPAGIRELGFNALRPRRRRPKTRCSRCSPTATWCSTGTRTRSSFPTARSCWRQATTSDAGVPLRRARVGIQFHLEVDRAEIELWLEAAGEDVVRAWGKTSRTSSGIDQPVHRGPRRPRPRAVPAVLGPRPCTIRRSRLARPIVTRTQAGSGPGSGPISEVHGSIPVEPVRAQVQTSIDGGRPDTSSATISPTAGDSFNPCRTSRARDTGLRPREPTR